jgi:single-strand DNA-binding protein
MYQKLMIIGRLGKDPEMRFTPAGQAVTSFSVATDRQWTDEAGKPAKETVWFRVSAWGKLAETCNNYLQKGKMVMVEGRLTVDPKTGGPRIWSGQDGTARATLEMVANTVKFLSAKESDQQQHSDDDSMPAEDIPF